MLGRRRDTQRAELTDAQPSLQVVMVPLDQIEGGPDPEAERQAKKSLRRRRLIVLALMLVTVYGIYHLFAYTGVLDPVMAVLGPARSFIADAVEDPQKALIAAAVAVIPLMGTMYYIFENQG